jgi:RNA polymerase sigma-70 factor (ECF subfamily)
MTAENDGHPSIPSDVLTQWEGGDPSGFVAALCPWQDSIFRIVCRILGNSHDAEDVCQTLMLRWLRTPGKLPQPARFVAWLRRCAVNEAIDFLRRQGRANGRLNEDVAAEFREPVEELADAELRIKVTAALEQLSAEQRALVTLRFDEGLTVREIAEVVERPSATVHFQLGQAIALLRDRLGIVLLKRPRHG